MRVLIDTHEPAIVEERLKDLGLETVRTKLEVGDYQIGEYVIERKTTSDFLSSIFDRRRPDRFRLQLMNLSEQSKRAIILEGPVPSRLTKKDFKVYRAYWSWKIGIQEGWKISVYETRDERETAYCIYLLGQRSSRKKDYSRPVRKRGLTLQERKEDILCCIPGIGRKQARILLEKEPVIGKLISKPKEELYSIKGVRKQSVDELFRHFWE